MNVSTLDRLPKAYPGELWYGQVARDLRRRGQHQREFRVTQILGGLAGKINVAFPNRVRQLLRHSPYRSEVSEIRYVHDHTLLPFHLAFEAPQQMQLLLERSATEDRPLIKMAPARPALMPKQLRYCRSCVDEDLCSVGEPYWRAIHQVALLTNCHQHGDRLFNSQVPYQPSRADFWTPHDMSGSISTPAFTASNPLLRGVATISLRAATQGTGRLYLSQADYAHLLRCHGFDAGKGEVASAALGAAFTRFAKFHGIDLREIGGSSWIRAIYTRVQQRVQPVQHILMRLFLQERLWLVPDRDAANRAWEARLVGEVN